MASVEPNPFDRLIDDLEISLKNFVAAYNVELIEHRTNQELLKKNSQTEQIKQNIEKNVSDLYEKAQNLERLFLKYRLEISQKAPEELMQEETDCLKAELKRKEELLAETKNKLFFNYGVLSNFDKLGEEV